jgi:thiamine pyrophosphate-dependent acetolactate synthase large subunit-like protein
LITIYAGAGCAGSHHEVVATAARLKAPMAHTSPGKDFVEYDNPYNVGMSGIIGQPAGYRAILNCDVLLTLGCDFAWSQFYPNKAKIIQIDADPTHIGRRHPVTIGAVGDIKATLEALLPRLVQHDDNGFLSHYVERHPKDRGRGRSRNRVEPQCHDPGDVPRQDHKQACGRGCVVHGRRRHYAARMTAAGPFTGELHRGPGGSRLNCISSTSYLTHL